MQGNDESSGTAASAGRKVPVRWPAWPRGTVALIAAAAVVALGLSACGGGATNNQGVAALPSTPSQPGPSGGGPSSSQVAGPGSTSPARAGAGGAVTTPPSAASPQEEALEFAECMRSRGIADFPDPRTSVPPHALPPEGGVISDIDGVTLVFPSTIDEQSPAFTAAAAACSFPLHNH